MEEDRSEKSIDSSAKYGRGWIAVVAFLVILIGMTAAIITVRRANGELRSPAPTQPVPLADAEGTPAVTPQNTPGNETDDSEMTTPLPEDDTPAPTVQPFLKTVIVVNGNNEVIVSSRQAAEELIRNVQKHFEDIANLPPNTITELRSSVEYIDAPEDSDIVSYDVAFAYFTGADTPLLFVSKSTYAEDSVIPHTDRVIADSMLPKGLRVARLLGRDGIRRKVFYAVFINGVLSESGQAEDYTLLEPINGDIRIGERVYPDGFEVKPGFGNDPILAHSIDFEPPLNGEVISYYGPFSDGFHHGIDISVLAGTEVRAAAKGTVVSVLERGSYGLVVEIQNEYSVVTRYARLDDAAVSIGDTVNTGDIIGHVCEDVHRDHLHFELRVRGTAYNPLKVLPEDVIKG